MAPRTPPRSPAWPELPLPASFLPQRDDTALLTREQLANLSGFSTAEIDRCVDSGMITPGEGGFGGVDLLKLQLVSQVADHAGGLDVILQRFAEGGFTLSWIELCLPRVPDISGMTIGAAMERAGVPAEEMFAVLRAAGMPTPSLEQPARADEFEFFKQYALVRALPVPVEARLHAVRVSAEGMRRSAEVQSEIFRKHVVEPILESHSSDLHRANTLLAQLSAAANPPVTAITGWLYQRYLEHEIIKSITQRMEEAAQEGGTSPDRQRDPSVMFIDLSGFTFVSADTGDDAAARLAGVFTDAVVESARIHNGRVIKMMGDGAMLFFEDGASAVRAGLALVDELPRAGLPAARVGINRGPVVAQSGDYYGTTINVAARINDYARPHEVLVADVVLPDGAQDVELEEIGPVTLKGVPRPVRLLRARAVAGEGSRGA